MDLIKCPRCGERYSPSYRKCPFCEEDGEWARANKRRSGHRVTEKKPKHSARGPMIVVLLVVLAVLSWNLFGEKMVAKIGELRADTPPTDTTPDAAIDPFYDPDPTPDVTPDTTPDETPDTTSDPATSTDPVDTTPDTPTPPVVDPTPADNVDVSNAKLNREDFTLPAGETFQMSVSGTSAAATWSVKDAAIASVSDSGVVKGLSGGNTTIYAKVGDKTLECIVRVKGTASTSTGSTTSTNSSTSTSADVSNAKLNRSDITIAVGEKFTLKVTGTTASVTWSIGNDSIASLSAEGVVKGLKSGTTTVYAKVGSKTLECIVRVK